MAFTPEQQAALQAYSTALQAARTLWARLEVRKRVALAVKQQQADQAEAEILTLIQSIQADPTYKDLATIDPSLLA